MDVPFADPLTDSRHTRRPIGAFTPKGSALETDVEESDSFPAFHRGAEPRLRAALVARFGSQTGREAALEALVYGWEHWQRVRGMDNPIGYLYRVGVSRARRLWRRTRVVVPEELPFREPWVEPELPRALRRLSSSQRQAVVLVHAYGLTFREAAGVLGVSPSTIQTHCTRGLVKLRSALGVNADA